MKQTELKPCPFCGGEADCGSFHGVAFFYVQCSCCGNCTKMYATAKEAAEKWNARTKPQTNLEKIQNMTIDEMADLFGLHSICSHIQNNKHEYCEENAVCNDCIRKWLESAAEEGDGNG